MSFFRYQRKEQRAWRDGHEVCEAEVVSVRSAKAFDHTNLLTMKVPKNMVMKARFFKEVRL